MKKIFLSLLFFCFIFYSFSFQLYSQTSKTNSKPDYTSTKDKGWYWSNQGTFKWDYLGAEFMSRLYYRLPIFRNMNSMFFANTHITAGMEFEATLFARVTAFIEFQPVVFFGITAKVSYEGAWMESGRPVLIDNINKDYEHAIFGTTKKDIMPVRVGGNLLVAQVAPALTLGAPLGIGLLAFIYKPVITYYKTFGVSKGSYVYYSRDNLVLKDEDIDYNHDITLGYSIPQYGVSFGVNSPIEHIQSYGKIWRIGIFAVGSYKKALDNIPTLTPFAGLKLGTWLIDRYKQYKVTIFAELGIVWKFN